jgi:hypothetical protein
MALVLKLQRCLFGARRLSDSRLGGARRLLSDSTDAVLAARRLKQAVFDGHLVVKDRRMTILERYARLLQERPLLTNAATSGILCALGDVLAQAVEWRFRSREDVGETPPPSASTRFDALRMARMGVYGFFVCGPLLTGWYRGLNAVGEACVPAARRHGHRCVERCALLVPHASVR